MPNSETESKLAPALKDLTRRSTDEALALLDALEDQRKQDKFVKYWEPITPKQEAVFEKFTRDIKVFGILGGNRAGKTEIGSFLAAAWTLGKEYFRGEPAWKYVKDLPIPEKGCNIWVVGLDFTMLRDVIWREKLRFGQNHPPLIPRDEVVYKTNDSDFQIFVDVGGRRSVITGKSADSGPAKFQAASVDLAWIDEECEAAVFNEIFQRTIDCGGKIILTLTPLSDINSAVNEPWVYDLHQDWVGGKKDLCFVSLSVLDNPVVPEDEKDRLKLKWAGHPEERARLYGEFVQRSGLVYKMWGAKHLKPRVKLDRDLYRVCCIDPAPAGPTACAWTAIEPSGDIWVYDTYKQANLTVSDHAKNILVQNQGQPIDLWLIDPKGGNQRNAETHRTAADLYREHGIPTRFPNLHEDYGLLASFEYLNAVHDSTTRQPRCYVFDDLTDFKDEIVHYVWDTIQRGDRRGLSKEKPRKGNDDILNCFQYICGHMNGRRPPAKRGQLPQFSEEEKRQQAALNSYT